MKLLNVKFQFENASVRWDFQPHVYNERKYNYQVHVVNNGVEGFFHANCNANKSNSIDFIKSTKP